MVSFIAKTSWRQDTSYNKLHHLQQEAILEGVGKLERLPPSAPDLRKEWNVLYYERWATTRN